MRRTDGQTADETLPDVDVAAAERDWAAVEAEEEAAGVAASVATAGVRTRGWTREPTMRCCSTEGSGP